MLKNVNTVQDVDLSGGTKGALWTGAAGIVANALQNANNGNGLVGGLLGGGCGNQQMMAYNQQMMTLMAEVAELKAEKTAAIAAKAESDRILGVYINPMASEIADAKVREAKLQAQIECLEKTQCLREQLLQKEIQLAKQETACCCAANATAIANAQAMLNKVTGVYIPNGVLTPGIPTVEVVHPTATAA